MRLGEEIRSLKNRTNRTQDENERLHSECSRLGDKVSNLEQLKKPHQILEERVKELQAQNQELNRWRSRAESLSIALEEEKRKVTTRSEDKKDQIEDRAGEKVYREEFNRASRPHHVVSLERAYGLGQKENMSSLRSQLSVATNEAAQLRESRREWDQEKRKALEEKAELKAEIRTLYGQLERARRDME